MRCLPTLALLTFAVPISGQLVLAEPSPMSEKEDVLGVGYKVGNGIGFFGGDVIINPIPHLSIDLHAAYVSDWSMDVRGTGFAVAPAVQARLRGGWGSGPYGAVGALYLRESANAPNSSSIYATGSTRGMFANMGWEWRWHSGLGIQLGGGVAYFRKVTLDSGMSVINTSRGFAPNLEFGIRYSFL